jgi:hypothetical protein
MLKDLPSKEADWQKPSLGPCCGAILGPLNKVPRRNATDTGRMSDREPPREGITKRDTRRKGDTRTRAVELYDYKTAAPGSHLPLEHTAPPWAVAPRSVARGPHRAGSGSEGDASTARVHTRGRLRSRYGIASSLGRHCSALRGRATCLDRPSCIPSRNAPGAA